jgi:Uma2 family endonuclease
VRLRQIHHSFARTGVDIRIESDASAQRRVSHQHPVRGQCDVQSFILEAASALGRRLRRRQTAVVVRRASRRTTAAAVPEPELQRRLFSIDEYERMIAAGILQEGERVELLGGEIYCMAAMGARHFACVMDVYDWFRLRLGNRATVRAQGPLRLPPNYEPEPDIALVRHRSDSYRTAHPGPADVMLVIEMADTSLRSDRELTLPRYAAAGIPDTWQVDLPGERILVHREPKDGVYTSIATFRRGDTLSPLAFPDLTLAVSDVLGPTLAG